MQFSISTSTLSDATPELVVRAFASPSSVLNESERLAPHLEPRYTVKETAKLLKFSEKTIRRYIAKGHLVAHRVGPKILQIPESSIVALRNPK